MSKISIKARVIPRNPYRSLQQVDVQEGVMFFVPSSWLARAFPVQSFALALTYIWCVGLGFSVLYQPLPFYHRYRTICQ